MSNLKIHLRFAEFSLICLFILSNIFGRTASAEDNIVYPVYKVNNEIALDPDLGDKVWNTFPTATDFFVLGKPEDLCPKQTYFKIAWDNDALYMNIICAEPDTDKIKCSHKDGGPLWTEDSIEIFIKAGEAKISATSNLSKIRTEQFIVNSAGFRYWHENLGRENQIAATGKIFKDRWIINLKIPFYALGKKPNTGEKWHFNIVRDNFTHDSKLSAWAAIISSLREEIDNCPCMCFYSEAISAEKAKSISSNLRWKHLDNILSKIARNEKECRFYLNEVKEELAPDKISSIENKLNIYCSLSPNADYDAKSITEAYNTLSALKDELLKMALKKLVSQ